MYTAAFDAGTTALKGVVLSDDKHIVFQKTIPLETICSGGFREQDPRAWYRAFCELCAEIAGTIPVDRIRGIIMSGQMQDLIPVDKNGEALGNAILYSDGRAEEEAAGINALVGADKIREITGNGMDGSIPAAKLLWLGKH